MKHSYDYSTTFYQVGKKTAASIKAILAKEKALPQERRTLKKLNKIYKHKTTNETLINAAAFDIYLMNRLVEGKEPVIFKKIPLTEIEEDAV